MHPKDDKGQNMNSKAAADIEEPVTAETSEAASVSNVFASTEESLAALKEDEIEIVEDSRVSKSGLRPQHNATSIPVPPTNPDRPAAMTARPANRPAGLRTGPPPAPPAASDPGLADARIGETLVGRYRLDRLVGKGGMGKVYRATQFPLNRPVAVKILNPDFQRKDPQFVRRFFLEAASAAQLTHPNTITVFDYGESEAGELFISMEFLEGRPLSRLIHLEGPFEGERVMHVAMQICRALREAHTKGIIHRDLKPGNILLLAEGDDADFVKVLDFGLVKLFNPPKLGGEEVDDDPITPQPIHSMDGELTKAGMFLGSPKYMSPEQIQGIPLDPRTDIYSLGVLMFQMAAGKPPFTGSTSVEVIYKHVNHPIPRIREVAPGVDIAPELEAVIAKCLSKKREERFASMGELLVRLKDVRRMLTGISSATETGISLDKLRSGQNSQVSVSSLVVESEPSATGASIRPQTHPAPGAIRAMPIQESPFADPSLHEDPTPSVMSEAARFQPGFQGTGGRFASMAPMIAGTALIVVLGVLAYVVSSSTPSTPSTIDPPVTPTVEPPQTAVPSVRRGTIRFISEPAGAEVFVDSVSLGKAPLKHTFPISVPEGESGLRQVVFKLKNHQPLVQELRFTEDGQAVRATLEPKQSEEDYKENPY